MNVLVLGEHGQVARCLRQRLPDARFLGRAALDLEHVEAIRPTLRAASPDFIINAAAYTAVDAAEGDRARAWRVNAEAVGEIAAVAAERAVPLLHISTDYVFAGDATQPYREHDLVAPVNAYGESKLDGERAALAAGAPVWIFRTSAVFSEFGHNFVKTMIRLAAERDMLSVVNDQTTRPTYAGDIADAIVQAWRAHARGHGIGPGVYHCASAGAATWYELATAAIERAAAAGMVQKVPETRPITTAEYPTPAARPRYSVLDTAKLEQALGIEMPHWRRGLDAVVGALRG